MYCWRSRWRAISSGVLFRPFLKRLLQQSQDPIDVQVDVCDRKEHSPSFLRRDKWFALHRVIVPPTHPSLKATVSPLSRKGVTCSVTATAAAAAATAAAAKCAGLRAAADHRERRQLLGDLRRTAFWADDLLLPPDELFEVRLALHADVLVHRHRPASVLISRRERAVLLSLPARPSRRQSPTACAGPSARRPCST